MTDRTIPPVIHDAIEFDYNLPPVNRQQLDNGLPLYWFSGGVQDVVEINFVFPAGVWYEPKPAVAGAVAALLKNGTATRSSHELHEALEFYGASLKINAGNDYATASLHTLTKHLPALLPVVYDVITAAAFPEEELAIFKRNTIQRLLVSERQCEFIANQQIDARLFGEAHPYGRFSKQEKIEALTREDLVAFYRKQYALTDVKIFMAGRIGEQEISELNEVFGKIALAPSAISQEHFATAAPAEQRQHILNDPNGVQAAIRIGRTFPNRHHPDFARMVVVNTLFGGYFGSRLMSNIREEKGYTYGIYSSLSPYAQGGSLIIHTEVGRDVMDDAVKEIYIEMDRLREEPVDEEELLLVKNYLLGGLLADLDGPFSILQRWRTLILNDFTVDNFNSNINIYKNITAAEIQDLARQYLDKKDFCEVTVI